TVDVRPSYSERRIARSCSRPTGMPSSSIVRGVRGRSWSSTFDSLLGARVGPRPIGRDPRALESNGPDATVRGSRSRGPCLCRPTGRAPGRPPRDVVAWGMADDDLDRPDREARNVLGEPLQPCGTTPLTGFYRDGCCNTGSDDLGRHTVCAVMTEEFLDFSLSQ